MVKIINHGLKPLFRRIGTGANVAFYPGEEVEVTDEKLIAELKARRQAGNLQIKGSVGKKDVGGGLKTGSRRPKRRGRPPKSKEEVKPKRKSKAKPKKPKGLKKSKRAD